MSDTPDTKLDAVISSLELGSAVIVQVEIVAWFADFNEEARWWCTENYFGEWLTWRAKAPEIVPLTEEECERAKQKGAEIAKRLKII